jgi:hypothetical protein
VGAEGKGRSCTFSTMPRALSPRKRAVCQPHDKRVMQTLSDLLGALTEEALGYTRNGHSQLHGHLN